VKPAVNFINVLHTAFTRGRKKRKKDSQVISLFTLSGKKLRVNMLVKLSLGKGKISTTWPKYKGGLVCNISHTLSLNS